MGHRRPGCPIDFTRGTGVGSSVRLAGPAQWLLHSLFTWAHMAQRPEPEVISVCRSRDRQIELQRQWDAGDRRGLRVRPADPEDSNHVADINGECWAFDLGNDDEWLRAAGDYVLSPSVQNYLPNARWGGSWVPVDLGHFDVHGMRSAAVIRLT